MNSTFQQIILTLCIIGIMGLFAFISYSTVACKKTLYPNKPLNLPEGSVRVFLIMIIVLLLLISFLLPAGISDNKSTSTLFGAFVTIVGFYFGLRSNSKTDTVSIAAIPGIKLTLASPSLIKNTNFEIDCSLPESVDKKVWGGQDIKVSLMKPSGEYTGISSGGIISSDGNVLIKFFNVPSGNYLIKVDKPPGIFCDEKIVVANN